MNFSAEKIVPEKPDPLDFLLIIPKPQHLNNDPKRLHPPIGPLSLITQAQRNGINSALFDIETEETRLQAKTGLETTLSIPAIIDQIKQTRAQIIGISCPSFRLRAATKKIATTIRTQLPDRQIIIGGQEVSSFYPEMLAETTPTNQPLYTAAAINAAEPNLIPLIQRLQKHQSPEGIPGVAFLKNHQIQKPLPANYDLTNFPIPDYSFLPSLTLPNNSEIDAYSYTGHPHIGHLRKILNPQSNEFYRYLPLSTSRGCPHDCRFCDNTRDYKRHTPNQVLQMISSYEKNFDLPDVLDFIDDNFGNHTAENHAIALEILNQVKQLGENRNHPFDLAFSNGLTFTSMQHNNYQLIRTILDSGNLKHLAFPFESGHPEILKTWKKPHSLELARQTAHHVSQLTPNTIREGFFLVAFPSLENTHYTLKQELDATYILIEEALKKNWIHYASVFCINPTTPELRARWLLSQHPTHPLDTLAQAHYRTPAFWPANHFAITEFFHKIDELHTKHDTISLRK